MVVVTVAHVSEMGDCGQEILAELTNASKCQLLFVGLTNQGINCAGTKQTYSQGMNNAEDFHRLT